MKKLVKVAFLAAVLSSNPLAAMEQSPEGKKGMIQALKAKIIKFDEESGGAVSCLLAALPPAILSAYLVGDCAGAFMNPEIDSEALTEKIAINGPIAWLTGWMAALPTHMFCCPEFGFETCARICEWIDGEKIKKTD